MTAPSLLDELEGVMPGDLDATAPAVIWLQLDTDGDNERRDESWAGRDGVTWCDESIGGLEIQYVRADLYRDMAKRLEAAERDAATERAIQNAADKLPDGYAISLYVENGSGYIDLTDPEGDPVPVDTDDRSIADQITQATKVAIDSATQEGEG